MGIIKTKNQISKAETKRQSMEAHQRQDSFTERVIKSSAMME